MKGLLSGLLSACMLLGCMISCKPKHIDQLCCIDVNGVSLVYRVVGMEGAQAVLLIHGNGGSHEELEATASVLVDAGYLVYSPDSRGQGANEALLEYHYSDMAEDMYQFVKSLGIVHPAVFGWSDGGIVALETEIMHPGTFEAISVSGANVTPDGLKGIDSVSLDSIREAHRDDSPLYQMMLWEPSISADELATIACPTQIVVGEHDIIEDSHTRYIAASIPGSELVILPGETHGSHIVGCDKMGKIVLAFLEEHGIRSEL